MSNILLSLKLVRPGFSMTLDLKLPSRGVIAIYGVSGSGKTTLLRFIAGLERETKGTLKVQDTIWEDETRRLPAHKRPIGYVFQDAGLLEHLSVQDNLRFGMMRAGITDEATCNQAVALLGIEHLLYRDPATLSGGERQRVGIARALALNPKVLLMDEPLSALDSQRKAEVLPYLERLHRELSIPMFYVTHSASEVIALADYVVILEDGAIKSQGPVHDVIKGLDPSLPTTEGTGVVLDATVLEIDSQWAMTKYGFSGGQLWGRDMGIAVNEAVRLRVLARDISISKGPLEASSIQNSFPATITEVADGTHPALLFPTVRMGDENLVVQLTKRAWHELGLTAGDSCWVHIKSVALLGCRV